MEAEIQKHERMAAPDVDGDEGLGPVGNEAFEVRDRLLASRGGPHQLLPTDDVDPAGDALILETHRVLGFVPQDADGKDPAHWGHSDSNAGGELAYNSYDKYQYNRANDRYAQYHRSQAEHLRKLRDGPGLIGALRGRETTGRVTRKLQRRQTPGILDDAARMVRRKRRWAELESELLGMGMPRQTGGAFVTPLTMSVADRLE